MTLKIFCDGSVSGGSWSRKDDPKPVECWAGWVAYKDDGTWLAHHSVAYGQVVDGSANFSEYGAVASSLMYLIRNKHTSEPIVIHSDSQLIIRQMSGAYACHNPRLLKIRDFCLGLAKKFPKVEYVWIRREQNKMADALSRCLQPRWGGVIPPNELTEEDLKRFK